MRMLSHLRLPWVHGNGVAQEIQVPENTSSFEEREPIKVVEQDGVGEPPTNSDVGAFLAVPELVIREVPPSQAPQFAVLEDIGGLEKFLESQDGVDKAQISLKTNKGGTRSLRIVIISTNPNLRPKQKRKLVTRLTNGLVARIDLSQDQISFKVQRASK